MRKCLILLLAAANPVLALDRFEYVDPDTVVAELDGQPRDALWYYRRYDQRLLRDWVVYCVLDLSTTGTSDLRWRQEMIAAYGLREDSSRLAEITDQLAKLEFSPQDYHNLLPSALLARHGDQDAQRQLLEQPPNLAVKILPYVRTAAALDKLAAIAANNKEDILRIRFPALDALCSVGDNRGLEIGLTEEIATTFLADRRREAGFDTFYTRMLGVDLIDEQINGPNDVRTIIQRKGFTLKPAKIKSVKGSIDWSKYRVKAGLLPLPQSLPEKIQQPSSQEPTAHDSRALIAVAAVVVGILGLLVWFLRKKSAR